MELELCNLYTVGFVPFVPSDVTAVCILEAFQNQQSMLLADKVLKQLGKEKAKDKYKVFAQFRDLCFNLICLNCHSNLILFF